MSSAQLFTVVQLFKFVELQKARGCMGGAEQGCATRGPGAEVLWPAERARF